MTALTRRRTTGRLAAGAAVLALLTGCSSGGGSGAGSSDTAAARTAAGATTAAAPARSFDPPATFAQGRATPLTGAMPGNVLLDGLTAYLTVEGGIRAVDVTTGRTLGTANGDHPGTGNAAPVAAEVGGKRLVLAAALAIVKGQGTAVDHTVVQLVAMDAGSHQVAWSLPADLPQGFGTTKSPSVLGVRGTTAVLAATDNDHNAIVAVDLAARKVLWTQNGFLGSALTDDGVVGLSAPDLVKRRLAAVKLTDGSPAWSSDQDVFQASVLPAGPNRVLVRASDYGSGKSFTRFTDGTTGKLLLDITSSLSLTCTYDERSVTVCANENTAFGLEPATGKVLWKLPDDAGTRVVPRVTGAWHGVVYGRTTNGPVALDATTGQDRPGNPQVAPVLVNGYVGLAAASFGADLTAYPVTG